MPIIVAGNEGDWALFQNTLNTTFGADTKRRGSVELSVGDQMFRAFTGTNDTWIHVRVAGPGNSTTASGNNWLNIRNSSGTEFISVLDDSASSAGQRRSQISRKQTVAGALVTNAELFTVPANQFQTWDIRIQRTTATNANDTITYSVYIDEILRFQESNVDATGWPLMGQITLEHRNSNANQDQLYYQDVIITDSVPTVGMELATLIPSAVGNYSQFTNDYTNIDDLGYDPSTVISTAATAQRESWVFSTPTFDLGDKVIYGVILNTVAQTDLANIVSDFRPFLRISGTDYDAAGNLGANNIAPGSYLSIFLTNPANSQPWQQANLTGLEAGVRSV